MLIQLHTALHCQHHVTTQDPLGFAAGDANLYRYVGNMATMATDPSGSIWYPGK